MAGRRPGLRPARQHMDVGAADPFEEGRERLGQAALPAIDAGDPGAAARQQLAGAQLDLRERAGHRPEQVGLAELAILAGIEDGQLPAVVDPGFQRGRVDGAGHCLSS